MCTRETNQPSLLALAMLLATGAALLSGCVALAIAPAAALVGGMANGSRENIIQVTIDEKTFTPEVRAALLNAKSLMIVAGDRASIKAADLFETRGGYVVGIDRPTAKVGEMTGSERRDVLRKLCANSQNPDVAMLGRVTRTETGNMMVGALTGRAKMKMDWIEEMLVCRTNTAQSFGGTLEFDGGIYNQKAESEFEELLGAEIGGKILDAIGITKTGQGYDRLAASASRPTSQTGNTSSPQIQQDLAKQEQTKASPADGGAKTMSTAEVQQKLIDLGYFKGKVDGKMGKNTSDALKKFQQESGIPLTGKPDSETIAQLRVGKPK